VLNSLLSLPIVSAATFDVPGIIQAEWFDEGGQNVGYYDATDGNSGDDVRDDIVIPQTKSV